MRKLLPLLLMWLIIGSLSAALALAQAPPPAPGGAPPAVAPPLGAGPIPGGPPGMGGMGGMNMDPATMRQRMEQFQKMMLDRQLERAKLTPAEDTAARKAIEARRQAQQSLQTALGKLNEAAMKDNAGEAELSIAYDIFQKSLKQYREQTNKVEAVLKQQLSVPAKARLTAMGVLDNGISSGMPGFGGMGGRMMGGPMGPGMMGGGMGQGGGFRPGGMRGRFGGQRGGGTETAPAPPQPQPAPAQ